MDVAEAVRRGAWRLGVRTAWGRACARDRAVRVGTLAAMHLATSLGLVLVAPLWVLLLGPLVLGVPHVVGDLRYLLIRRHGGPGWAALLPAGIPLLAMTALRAASVAGLGVFPRWELACGVATVLGFVSTAPAGRGLRVAVSGLVLVAGALALDHALLAALVLGHAHNLVGVGLWLTLACRRRAVRAPWLLALTFAAILVALLTGALEPVSGLSAPVEGFEFGELVDTLAPGLDPTLGFRLVLAFAFAQSVHYAVWTRLLPGALSDGPAAPTLRRALRALRADVGAWGVRAAVVGAILVPAMGVMDPVGTRALYLSLVLFHGWLELGAAARLAITPRAGRP